ncbi:ABC transporter substrate-binding protein [Bifidobacterium samirii]|uniref:ABC superfamily ATP binding cassette transporter solute-binding protein n=1 Tax=Bifidobacterium samirii TaxID=2306974 RepID=A0A430FWH6_9BIFI|nr:ABC transporter substrate-binding protein [Bifidobacterium samirii]RSX58399.1 ABC superfamily ATP binding cassette transporter solute-binding protein [Bifidobacterium samirii]
MHRRTSNSLRSWLIFIATATALSVIVAVVWSSLGRAGLIPDPDLSQDRAAVIGLTDAPDTLDIRTDSDPAVERALLGNVYETLLDRDDDNKVVAGLASQWTVSDDALTYTFTIPEGLTFSNGDTLDSSDAVWSLQQLVEHQYVGHDGLDALAGVTNPDPTTLVLTLSRPDPTIPRTLTGRAGIIHDADATAQRAIDVPGSGPFTIESFTPGERIELAANPHHHGDAPASGHITIRYHADATTLADALKNGDVDAAAPADPTDAAALASALGGSDGSSDDDADGNADGGSFTIADGTSTSETILTFNHEGESILSDEQVRRAVRYAIDNASIAAAQPDAVAALGGPIGPLEDGYEDLTGAYPYNPDTARGLLSYFYANYFGTLDLLVPTEYADMGNTIAGQLGAVGLTVTVETLDKAEVERRVTEGSYTLAVTTTDGVDDTSVYATSDNVMHYTSGTVQQAWKAAMAATSQQDYETLLRAYAATVGNDAPCDWLYARKTTVAMRAGVSGLTANMADRRLPLAKLLAQ